MVIEVRGTIYLEYLIAHPPTSFYEAINFWIYVDSSV
jgi:hypothetical protein